ncbi:hypothetical protein AB3673_16985 [Acinetobacter baumannii]
MKSKLGISKQLFIALTIVNLSVTLFSVVLGYVIYNYAIEKGWISRPLAKVVIASSSDLPVQRLS